jgi:arginine repressor
LANQNQIEEALQSQQPEIELETVVRKLSEEGLTRKQIYQFFLDYQLANQDKAGWDTSVSSRPTWHTFGTRISMTFQLLCSLVG